MALLGQTLTVTALSLRSVIDRQGNTLVIVVGMTGVAAVLLAVLAMYAGFRQTIGADGRPDRAIVLSRSALAEYESNLSLDDIATIANAAGIRRDTRGRPIVSAEVVLMAPVAHKRDGSDVTITLRGVGEQYFALRPELKLIAGRMLRRGTQELLVGDSARQEFAGLEIGSQLRLQGGDWTIVGIFAGEKGARDSELLADARTVMSVYRLTAANTLTALLTSASALPVLQEALRAQPSLSVQVRAEPQYLASGNGTVNRMLRLVANGVGSLMALGALFAAVNSTHSAVAARQREIATLRAIGYSGAAVAAAILLEAALLAALGAAAGVAIAYAGFNGTAISTLGGALFDSQLVYTLRVTLALSVLTVGLACLLGLMGAAFPALRAARISAAQALRES